MVHSSFHWQSQRRLLGIGRRCLFSLLVLLLGFLPSTASHAYPAARVQTTAVVANPASLFVVNSTADPGDGVCTADECTLREAITAANLQFGTDTISFNLPGPGPHTILPFGDLPPIRETALIDGYTQPGAVPNTNLLTESINGMILIELTGTNAQSGLVIEGVAAAGTVIRGLAINRFPGNGIIVATHAQIRGNFIGTDPSGTMAVGNGVGILVAGPVDGQPITPLIGGEAPAERNLIAGNGVGIEVMGNSYPTVQGNFIGTNVVGNRALGNEIGVSAPGPVWPAQPPSIQLGGWESDQANLISGNGQGAVLMETKGSTEGNRFGTDRTGQAPLPNRGDGLVIVSASHLVQGNLFAYNAGNGIRTPWLAPPRSANLTTITGNTIAHNGKDGITIPDWPFVLQWILISGNKIYDNGELGIDVDDDGVTVSLPPSTAFTYPTLTRAGNDGTTLFVTGSARMNNQTLRVEIFANATCDPSGYGEGQEPIYGLTVVKSEFSNYGSFELNLPIAIPPGYALTATATHTVLRTPSDPTSFTSEFSSCRYVSGLINGSLTLTALTTSYNPLPWSGQLRSTMMIIATFQNSSSTILNDLFFKTKVLTNDNQLIAVSGVPNTLAPGASFTVDFQIGLRERKPFTFLTDAYGLPADPHGVSAAPSPTAGFTYNATVADLGADQQVDGAPRNLYLPWIER